MAEFMQDIKHLPPWLIIAGVGGIGAVVLLVRRGSGSGAVVSTVPAASITATPDGALQASGLAGGPVLGDATQLQSMSTLPQATAAPTQPAPQPALGFRDWLNEGLSGMGGAGLHLNTAAADTTSQNAAIRDYVETGAQFAGQGNGAFDSWLTQGEQYITHTDPNWVRPDVQQQWIGQGAQFLTDPSINQQAVTPVGTQVRALPAAGGGSSEKIVDILPHGYATEMSPGVLQRWADWMGGTLPQPGLDDTQRYVARTTHRELAARHKAAADDAVNELLGGM